jgi:chorismate mutase
MEHAPKPRSVLGLPPRAPLILAGPCSAESEEQVMSTARQIASLNRVSALRAGIWKPRTRPGSFEGVGSRGLEWLRRARAETGLPVAVEVANVRHVDEALRAGVDILWIGARTTVNPFDVQDIADALRGTDVAVAVKNPINPDLELWMGAIERLGASVRTLVAIHRGFSSYDSGAYRNKPMWELPIELRRRLPELPLICDPSHICGRTDTLLRVAQTAIDLDYDGLMIETHAAPEAALSDAQQQITPEALGQLLDRLMTRRATVDEAPFLSALEDLRDAIDVLDTSIIETLGRRMEIARAIGRHKRDQNVTILQRARWDTIVGTRTEQGVDQQLSREFVVKLFEMIHQESIHHQIVVMEQEHDTDGHPRHVASAHGVV